MAKEQELVKQYNKVPEVTNLLGFKPLSKKTNVVEIKMKWDANDGDYRNRTETWCTKYLFEDPKMLYILAYISLPCDFKGKDEEGNNRPTRFRRYVVNNNDIEDIQEILREAELTIYDEYSYDMCHSCESIDITYYDENGAAFKVTFDGIIEEFKKMSYEEICNKINSMELKEFTD